MLPWQRVGLTQISLTQLNLTTPEPPGWCNNWVMSYIQAKLLEILCLITTIGYRGNMGWSGISLNDTIKLADPENPLCGANSLYVSSTMPKLLLFKVTIGCNAIFHIFG